MSLTEQLLESMNIVAESVVNNVQFNKTVICQIVDDSSKEEGAYRVSDGATEFTAYSENGTYKNGTAVYVTIPNGDFSNQKIILGKKTEVEGEPFNYLAPLDNFFTCTPNILASEDIPEKMLKAGSQPVYKNNSNEIEVDYRQPASATIYKTSNINHYFQGFSRLAIRANFRTALSDMNIVKGNYGLCLRIHYYGKDVHENDEYYYEPYIREYDEKGEPTNKDTEATAKELYYYSYNSLDQRAEASKSTYTTASKELPDDVTLYIRTKNTENVANFFLEVNDMIGSPYNFETYFTQEKMWDISFIENITDVEFIFFQANDFYDINGNPIVYPADIINPDNLFTNGLELYFGYDVSEIDEEFVQIYTFDALNYQHADNKTDNKKTIELRWAHKDGDKINVFTKDNLERYYDELLENGDEDNFAYTVEKDNSLTPVQYRQYYQRTRINGRLYEHHSAVNVDPEKREPDNTRYKLSGFKITQQPQSDTTFFMRTYYPFGALKYNSYFVEEEKLVIDDIRNYYVKKAFALNEKGDTVDGDGKQVVPTLLKKVRKELTNEMKQDMIKSGMYKEYTFYIYATDGSVSPAGITSPDDFEEGKIYRYDTYEEVTEQNIIESVFGRNSSGKTLEDCILSKDTDDCQYYVYMFAPIDNSQIESYQWGIGEIYAAIFERPGTPEEQALISSNYYTINVSEVSEEYINKNYKPDTFYYRKYDISSQFEIRWYRYQLGAPAADEYSGLYWERIPYQSEEITTCVDDPNTPFTCYLYPDFIYNKTEQIKAVLLVTSPDDSRSSTTVIDEEGNEIEVSEIKTKRKAYTSNIIIFENKSEVINVPTVQQEFALRLNILDGTLGNYLIYDESNNLIDQSAGAETRELQVLFDKEDFNSMTPLERATKVIWTFPLDNTMLKVSTDNNIGDFSKNGIWGTLTVEDPNATSYSLFYSIDNYYTFGKHNNTITCTVEKDGELFSTVQEFSFGTNGSNGSDYTLVLDLLTSDSIVTLNKDHLHYEKIIVDEDGEEKSKKISLSINDFYLTVEDANAKLKKETNEAEDGDKTNIKFITPQTTISFYEKQEGKQRYQEVKFDTNKKSFTPDEEKKYYIRNNLNMNYYVEQLKFDEKNNPVYVVGEDGKEIKDEDGNLIQDTEFVKLETLTPIEENRVRATLYNQANQKVDLGGLSVEWEWTFDEITPDQELFTIHQDTEKPNEAVLKVDYGLQDALDQICILTARLKKFGDYDLVAHLPIPLRRDFDVTRFQGPTQIIYSTTGIPNYYGDAINLYYNDSAGAECTWPNELNDKQGFRMFPLDGDNHRQKFFPQLSQKTIKSFIPVEATITRSGSKIIDISFEPELNGQELYIKKDNVSYTKVNTSASDLEKSLDKRSIFENMEVSDFVATFGELNGNKFQGFYILDNGATSAEIVMTPLSTYIGNVEPFAIQYKYNDVVKFTQPILNIQNRYFSSTINKWDGALSVDGDKNTILAKMIGAGHKDSNNQFSGVLMGDWTGNVNKNDGGSMSLSNKIGLYGFNKGETSFGFTEDGMGFIGKAGRGRILLDGENSVITSSAWYMYDNTDPNNLYTSNHGLYIDIDDAFILMRDGGSGRYIKLNALATGSADKKSNNYQGWASANPVAGGTDTDYPFVVYGDEHNFAKIGWNGQLYLQGSHEVATGEGSSKEETGYIYLNASADKYPLDINSHFAVAWNGALTISTKNITNNTNYNEKPSNIIATDDQRNYTRSKTQIADDAKVSEQVRANTDQFNYNQMTVNQKLNDATAIIEGVDNNKTRAQNPYDYSTLQPTFTGFYATPEGDLYLSRKLVIGNRFSATSDGYLRAKEGIFDNCNANVFQVRCIDPLDGVNVKVDLSKTTKDLPYSFEAGEGETLTDAQSKIKDAYLGAKIGTMGWIQGLATDSAATMNLGIESMENCGIKLISKTNMSLDVPTLDDENNANFGLFQFNGKNTLFNLTNAYTVWTKNVVPEGKTYQEDVGYIRFRAGNKIQGHSNNLVRFATEFVSAGTDSETSTEHWQANIDRSNRGGEFEKDKQKNGFNTNITSEFVMTHKSPGGDSPAIRLWVPGSARLSLGQDKEGNFTDLGENNYFKLIMRDSTSQVYDKIFDNNATRIQHFYLPQVRGYAATTSDASNYNSLAGLDYWDMINFDVIRGQAKTTIELGVNEITLVDDKLPEGKTQAEYHTNFSSKLDLNTSNATLMAASNFYIRSGGTSGPAVEGITNIEGSNGLFLYGHGRQIMIDAETDGSDTITAKGKDIALNGSSSVISTSAKVQMASGNATFTLEGSTLDCSNVPASAQTGIYARFA